MNFLSDEVVLHILSFCDAESLCLFSSANKLANCLANDGKLWEKLCIAKKFPWKRGNSPWKTWYFRMIKRVLVNCRWHYGEIRSVQLLMERNVKQKTIKLLVSRAMGFSQPERIVFDGEAKDDEMPVPKDVLSTGNLVCWVK